MFKQSLLGLAMFSFLVIASTGSPASARTSTPASNARVADSAPLADAPFKATGTHTCYKADTSFRPTCTVSGGGFSDCEAARAALKADDCCPRTEEGTKSYSFSMDTCGPE